MDKIKLTETERADVELARKCLLNGMGIIPLARMFYSKGMGLWEARNIVRIAQRQIEAEKTQTT